jgi:uncharacterized membrane protein YgaE (UPF0421/DUF939 family)
MLKTALSVMACLLLARLLSYHPPVFACVAAVIVTKENIESSFKQGVDRVLGALVGGVVALIFLFLSPARDFYIVIPLVGAGVLFTLYICLLLKIPDAAALACVAFLIIVLLHPEDKYIFALTRVGETIAGICVSLLINRIIPGKKPEAQMPG